MINRKKERVKAEEDFNLEKIANEKKATFKQKSKEASKKLLHDSLKEQREKDNANFAKLYELLEKQNEMLTKLIEKDDEVEHTENTEIIMKVVFDYIKPSNDLPVDEDSAEFAEVVDYFTENYDLDIDQERLDNPNATNDGVLLELWIIEQNFGDDTREQIIEDIENIKTKTREKR